MKINKNKILMSLLVGGLIVGLTTPNIIKANELDEVKEDEIIEVEESPEAEETIETDETVEENDSLEVEGTDEKTKEKEVETAIPFASSRAGVPTLTADVTTLGEAFPDVNFRKYVAESILLKASGSYDETTVLTAANITKISTVSGVYVNAQGITSLEGIKHFSNINTLSTRDNELVDLDVSGLLNLSTLAVSNNKLETLNITNTPSLTSLNAAINNIEVLDIASSTTTSLTGLNVSINKLHILDVSAQLNLQSIDASFNYISEIDLSNASGLNTMILTSNPIASLNISPLAKANITRFQYELTDVESFDLTGFSSLVNLGVTKSTGGDLSNLTNLRVSGSKAFNKREYTGITVTSGSLSLDTTNGYYVIAPDAVGMYSFAVNIDETDRRAMSPNYPLTEGALVDKEGNIVIGADASGIKSDGSIVLENGGTVLSGGGIYEFTGKVTIKDGVITTDSDYVLKKNTGTYDEATGTVTANVGDVGTSVSVGNGSASINTNDDSSALPNGSAITNNDGDVTYVTGATDVDAMGNVNSTDRTITVPSDKTGDIAIDSDGNITLPEGSVVTDNGTDVTYPGTIIYNPEDNTVKYMPIDDLFDEDGIIKDEVTQDELDEAKNIIDQLAEGDLKEELKDKLEDAQNQLNEKEAEKAVDDLFDEDGKIKEDVTQEDIDNAEDLVNKLPEGDKKEELKDKLKDAQKQLDEKNFVLLKDFEEFTGSGSVSAKVDAPVEKFSKVYVDGKELDTSNYEVTSGSTVITLKESYLQTLLVGSYKVEIVFDSGARVPATLKVNTPQISQPPVTNPSTKPSTNPSTKPTINGGGTTSAGTVNTGDTTDLTALYAMLATSLLGLVVVVKRRKEQA